METNIRGATRVQSALSPLRREKLRWRGARPLFEILSDICTCIDFFFFLRIKGIFSEGEVRGQGRWKD